MKSPYIGISRGPVLDYPHTDGRAVIGGYVYRGQEFARDLGGKYIFGDNVLRTVWALDETATPVHKNPALRHAARATGRMPAPITPGFLRSARMRTAKFISAR